MPRRFRDSLAIALAGLLLVPGQSSAQRYYGPQGWWHGGGYGYRPAYVRSYPVYRHYGGYYPRYVRYPGYYGYPGYGLIFGSVVPYYAYPVAYPPPPPPLPPPPPPAPAMQQCPDGSAIPVGSYCPQAPAPAPAPAAPPAVPPPAPERG